MTKALSRRSLLALSAVVPLSGCSRVMFSVRFTIEDSAREMYEAALHEFLRRYAYRETEWRPRFLEMPFEGVWEGLRTHFWIGAPEPNILEAWVVYKDDLFGAFAPGPDVWDIGEDFQHMISAVEGVRIEQGY